MHAYRQNIVMHHFQNRQNFDPRNQENLLTQMYGGQHLLHHGQACDTILHSLTIAQDIVYALK